MIEMTPVSIETADEAARPILEEIKGMYGLVPNFYSALGIDGASLRAYLAFESSIESDCLLSLREREMISLAVANKNGCHYCVSGHTFSAKKMAGMSQAECKRAQCGSADDPVEQAVIALALRFIASQGNLEDADRQLAAEAGIGEKKLVQICAWTAMNSFSNWINNLVQPKIDFPKVDLEPVK